MDDASMLQIKRGLVLVERELVALKEILTRLASTIEIRTLKSYLHIDLKFDADITLETIHGVGFRLNTPV